MKRHITMFVVLGLMLAFSIIVITAVTLQYMSGGFLTYIDLIVERWFVTGRTPAGFVLFHFFSLLVSPEVVLLLALLVSVRLWRWRQKGQMFFLWMLLLISQGSVMLMKTGFSRPRPEDVLPPFFESTYAFPSGHAVGVVAFYGFLAYIIMRSGVPSTWKFLAPLVWILLILMVDISRMYLGVHYLTDVITGNFFGLVFLVIVVALREWLLIKKKMNV